MSGAATVTVGEVLPAASDCDSVSDWPFACAGCSGAVKLPSAATVALPIVAPCASRTVTLAPASPVPDRLAPFAATLPIGVSGAVVSGATIAMAGEGLPAASVCTAVSVSPLRSGGFNGAVKLPSAATIATAAVMPAASVTTSRAPGSPVPAMIVPLAVTLAIGAAGGVLSAAVIVTGADMLPVASRCVADRASPLRSGVPSVAV